MKKRQILKALSLLTAICMAAGCNGSTAVETTSTVDITATTTAEITTTSSEVTEETTTVEAEEANGIKYCEIPEDMTFEDLCCLFYYKDTQLKFPCTLDEILALDEEFKERFYSENKSVSKVFKSDENGFDLDSITLGTNGDLNSNDDVSKCFHFVNIAKESQEYSFYQDVLSFNSVHYGDDILLIKELLGKPSYEETGYCNYYFYKENKSIFLEFRYTDDGKFLSACFDYIMEEK